MSKRKESYFLFDFALITMVYPSNIFFRVKRHYQSKKAKEKIKGSCLIISNHIDFCDWMKIFLSFPYRRIHVFTLTKAFQGKFKNFVFKKMLHCIAIDDYKMSLSTFKETISLVKEGRALSIFPEGHIQDHVFNFKDGASFLSSYNDIPIIPLYLKRRKNIFHMTHTYIGDRIDPKDFIKDNKNKDEIKAFTNHLENIMKELEKTANS